VRGASDVNRRWMILAAVLVFAGCASAPGPSPSAPGSVAPGSVAPSIEPSAEPSVALPIDPGVAGLTCGDGLVFHPSLLAEPGHAETDPDAAADALRVEIDGSASELMLPRSGWVRVAQLADRVQFVAPDGGGDGWFVAGFLVRDGRWTLDLMGECQPEVVLPAGVSRAEWRLDPAFPPPAADDRQIHVLINELACASGQSPQGRVLPPIVASGPTAVTIAILVTNRPGGQDCLGNPDFPVVVDLPEPLGGRQLLDGAVFPPRDVTQPAGG
jgi:hypothetical protein